MHAAIASGNVAGMGGDPWPDVVEEWSARAVAGAGFPGADVGGSPWRAALIKDIAAASTQPEGSERIGPRAARCRVVLTFPMVAARAGEAGAGGEAAVA